MATQPKATEKQIDYAAALLRNPKSARPWINSQSADQLARLVKQLTTRQQLAEFAADLLQDEPTVERWLRKETKNKATRLIQQLRGEVETEDRSPERDERRDEQREQRAKARDRLRQLIESRGLKIAQIAARSDLSEDDVYRRLGDPPAKLSSLRELADALGFDLDGYLAVERFGL